MVEFAVRRPVSVFMICLGLIALGLISASRIQMQLLPTMVTPEFAIVTKFKGATPAEVERIVTAPIERAVSTISGLYKTESFSQSERSEIKLNFKSNINYLETLSILRDKIEAAGLPEGVARPKLVRSQSSGGPILRLVVSNKKEGSSLLNLAGFLKEDLVRKLEGIDGLALASLLGAPQKEIEIIVNPATLWAYGIRVGSLPAMIKENNKSFSAGQIQYLGKEVAIRLGNLIESIDQLKKVVVKREEGKIVRLGDIAIIREVVKNTGTRTRLQGSESLIIDIKKEAEANTVEVTLAAEKVINKFLDKNKDELDGIIIINQGKEIKASIDSVIDAVVSGGVLAAIVIFIFLQSYGPTAIVAFSIPMSLMITLILMYFTGVSFNLMSLGGLALGVGMLVDNSIVVLENINRYQTQMDDLKDAAIWGTKKVSGAIVSSTLTTVAVFAPLIFVEGAIGQMFKDISLTVVYSLTSSLFVAIIVIPMMSSFKFGDGNNEASLEKLNLNSYGEFFQYSKKLWLLPFVILKNYGMALKIVFTYGFQSYANIMSIVFKAGKKGILWVLDRTIGPVLLKVSQLIEILQRFYTKRIDRYLLHKWKTLGIVFVIFSVSFVAFIMRGAELFPEDGVDRIIYQLEYPSGQPLEVTQKKIVKLEKDLLTIDDVKYVSTVVGNFGPQYANILFIITPSKLQEIKLNIQKIFDQVPALKYSRVKEGMMGGGKPLAVEIRESNLIKLKDYALLAKGVVKKVKGLVDIDSDLKSDIFELSINFDKSKLNQFGVGPNEFITPLKNMIQGKGAGKIQMDGEDLPVNVSVAKKHFNSLDKIGHFAIKKDEKEISLAQVAPIDGPKGILGMIRRLNRKRIISIYADLKEIDLQTASQKVKEALTKKLPKDINWRIGGMDEERKKSEKGLIFAILLSIFLIYLLLASQFESLKQPFIILFAVPLCLVGVSAFLVILNMNISALVFVGFIILAGISVNTSIVLVDAINQLRLGGVELKQSIVQASQARIKPILMTALSTVIGLLPMALAMGQGGSMRRPLAITVIGGLLSSTILTVVVVPLIYYLFGRGKKSE